MLGAARVETVQSWTKQSRARQSRRTCSRGAFLSVGGEEAARLANGDVLAANGDVDLGSLGVDEA